MNNPKNPEPKTWVRLVMIAGATCAVITIVEFVLATWLWHTNANSARVYDKVGGPTVCVTMLTTFLCGVILRKRCSVMGWVLIGLALLSFVFGLLFPEL